MHRLLDLGLYREAIIASRQILNHAGLDDAATLAAPIYFNRIRFGPYFGDLIMPEAASYGLDGLFLLSVVRQESLFEGFATSSAAARGLMQVIPSTGESIAGQLGWPEEYETRDLYRPLVSVRFGTYYLNSQQERFDGDLYAALAAYNGGPGNAIAWKELGADDPDLFLEIIRFAETHRYIQVIYEVFEIYKLLYASG
jgi:soluble lytic murein transglycosylase